MAIPIKDVPVLTGELAENFILQAEKRTKGPRWIPDQDLIERVKDIVANSKNFVPSWRRK